MADITTGRLGLTRKSRVDEEESEWSMLSDAPTSRRRGEVGESKAEIRLTRLSRGYPPSRVSTRSTSAF